MKYELVCVVVGVGVVIGAGVVVGARVVVGAVIGLTLQTGILTPSALPFRGLKKNLSRQIKHPPGKSKPCSEPTITLLSGASAFLALSHSSSVVIWVSGLQSLSTGFFTY